MWKFLICIAVLQISQTFAARTNGYFRAFRRGYYPGKPDYQNYATESRSYNDYSNHRGHGYGYPAYSAVYLLGPNPMGRYGYPVFPYHRYGEQDESIYDYKLKMQPKEEPMAVEKLETYEKPQEGSDVMKMNKMVAEMKRKEKMRKMKEMQRQKEQVKMMEEKRRKMMEQETVHAPKYVPREMPKMEMPKMEMPKMVTMTEKEKNKYVRPTVRTRVVPTKKESAPKKDTSNAGLVFNGKYSGSCSDDGLYYRDETSYVICTNTQAIVQPCAPGTQNQDMMTFTPGSKVSRFDFCTINLVARGSYISQRMGGGDEDEKMEYMNERVKNYFEQHYSSYS